MKKLTLRLDDGMAARLTASVGARGINRLLVELIEGWLEGDASDEVAPVPAVVKAAVVRAADLPATGVPEGAVCSFLVRGGMCGKPAKFARGPVYRCEEH